MKASRLIKMLAESMERVGDADVTVCAANERSVAIVYVSTGDGFIQIDLMDSIDEATVYRDRIAELETDLQELQAKLSRCDTIPAPGMEAAE